MGGGRGGDAGQRLSLRSSPWSRVCSVQHGRGRMEGLHPGGARRGSGHPPQLP